MLTKDAWKAAFKIGLVILLLIGMVYFSYLLADIFAMFIVALLVVYAIFPLVNFLKRKGMKPGRANIAAFTIFASIIIAISAITLPGLYREISNLARFINQDLLDPIQNILETIHKRFGWLLPEINVNSLMEQLPSTLQTSAKELSDLVLGIFTGAGNVFFTLLMVFFLLQDLEGMKDSLTRMFPVRYQQHVTGGIALVDEKVGAFLRGNIIRCTVVGIIDGALFAFFGMPFAVTLGLIAGITNIIPYIGPIVGAVPGVLISLSGNTPHSLLIILIYVAGQAVDNIYLIPYLLGKAVNLRPITVIVALLVGGRLMGILGMILAIPVSAVIKALLEVYYMSGNTKPNR